MKKKIGSILAMLLLLAVPTASLRAAESTEQLFKFVKFTDGTYGYDDNTPVYTYNGSGEEVMIPSTYTHPKRQFRSAWVATIANLNMPKAQTEADFKREYTKILDTFTDWNMNAMIFQVSPLLDSYYPSEIKPWSEFIKGGQGTDPGYDPLMWMVDETHQRNMEFHAWFNPYRVTNSKITGAAILNAIGMTAAEASLLTIPEHIEAFHDAGLLAENNFAVLHPEWVLRFEEKLFLDPGIPEVREHVIDTVKEVLENYDVDAIHFDDYFYPYRITVNNVNVYFGDDDEDRNTFLTYGIPGDYSDDTEGIEQWRRDNITALVEGIKAAIDEHNETNRKSVQLGISPFGIWEHKTIDDRGSNTPEGSSETYSKTVFADTYKWIKDETLDYILPQVYWSFDQAAAPYGELTQWWSSVAEGTHVQVYIGHPNYKHVNNGGWDASWMNPQEVPNQMKFNQKYDNIAGSALFSYNDIIPSNIAALPADQRARHQAKNESIQLLHDEYFNVPALAPAKPWLASHAVTAPSQAYFSGNSTTSFTWNDSEANSSKYYVIYRGNGSAAAIISQPQNIIAKIWRGDDNTFQYDDLTNSGDSNVSYVITALDAAHNESTPLLVQKKKTGNPGSSSGGSESDSTTKPSIIGTWKQNSTGWWYQNNNGTWPISTWTRLGDFWYFFNQEGYMNTGWLLSENHWYFLNPGGNMVSKDWTLYQNHWYYLLESGSMAANQWVSYKDHWYYLGGDGILVTNITTSDGYVVDQNGAWTP